MDFKKIYSKMYKLYGNQNDKLLSKCVRFRRAKHVGTLGILNVTGEKNTGTDLPQASHYKFELNMPDKLHSLS